MMNREEMDDWVKAQRRKMEEGRSGIHPGLHLTDKEIEDGLRNVRLLKERGYGSGAISKAVHPSFPDFGRDLGHLHGVGYGSDEGRDPEGKDPEGAA